MTALVLTLLLGQNYMGYPVAPRAAGMGGAAAALGEGAANTFYNPAAVAWGTTPSTDVSGNVFAASLTRLTGEFGDSVTRSRFGLQVIPSNMTFEWHGLKFGPVNLGDRWGAGVSIVAPFDIQLGSLTAASDGSTLVLMETAESTYAIYTSLGYQLTDRVSIGVSVVAMYRSFTATAVTDRDTETFHESLAYFLSEKSIGHALAFGAQWRPEVGFRLGGAVRVPLQQVYGFGEEHGRLSAYDKTSRTFFSTSVDRAFEARWERPWRFNLGVGWESDRFALAAELTAFTPLEFISARDSATGETLEVTRLRPVLNVSVGAEVRFGRQALRAGFFTDHSPHPAPAVGQPLSPEVDHYGGTLSLAWDRAPFASELGLVVTGGRLTTLGYDVVGGTFAPIQARGSEWRFMVTYSSTIRY